MSCAFDAAKKGILPACLMSISPFYFKYCHTTNAISAANQSTHVANNIGATLVQYREYWRILANIRDIAPLLEQYLQQ